MRKLVFIPFIIVYSLSFAQMKSDFSNWETENLKDSVKSIGVIEVVYDSIQHKRETIVRVDTTSKVNYILTRLIMSFAYFLNLHYF